MAALSGTHLQKLGLGVVRLRVILKILTHVHIGMHQCVVQHLPASSVTQLREQAARRGEGSSAVAALLLCSLMCGSRHKWGPYAPLVAGMGGRGSGDEVAPYRVW